MNLFRCTPDKSLDREYLRICAVYRLLAGQKIGKARAIELLTERRVKNPVALVELWIANPFRHLAIAA